MADAFTDAERAAIIARRAPYAVACPFCGAAAGVWCRTATGAIVKAHASRRAASARAVEEARRG